MEDGATLARAYDDKDGATAAFNLNVLHRFNRELGADFDTGSFRHRARWNRVKSRIEKRIELISDWIRTHHRRDRSKENRRGRNWNRRRRSAAYIIDTSRKQPREHAVKFQDVARSIAAGVLPASRYSGTNPKHRGETISENRFHPSIMSN